jgi:hypothetical protein
MTNRLETLVATGFARHSGNKIFLYSPVLVPYFSALTAPKLGRQTQPNQEKTLMKKIAIPFIACLAIASSAFAGHEMKESKEYKGPVAEPCFKDQELQLDVFGSWTNSIHDNPHHDGFGGGVAVNYFFMKYLGVGVEGNLYDGNTEVWDLGGRIIARLPIEGSVCIAPYAFVGGGVMMDSTTVGTWNAGGGLEWRATHSIGIFGEGRYVWGGNDDDAVQVRAGVRFVF